MNSYLTPVPRSLLYGSSVLIAFGLLTPNPTLTVIAIAVVPLLFALLWRPGEPPALLFAAGLQWLSVVVPVIHANLLSVPVGVARGIPEMETAAWLGILAIVTLAVGMRFGIGGRRLSEASSIDAEIGQLELRWMLVAYLITMSLSLSSEVIAGIVPAARQLVLTLSDLRWIIVFIMLLTAVRVRSTRPLIGTIFVVEIALGFGGYFSGFKFIFYLAVLAVLARGVRSFRFFRPVPIALVVVTLALGIVWQAIKQDYRSFLNQGTGQQVVLVSPVERATFVVKGVVDLRGEDLARGVEAMIDRLGYLEFFARSLQMVPAYIPFQEGRLWGEAARHVLMPRLLFPEKGAVNDSDRTNEFSGVRVADSEEGTSIGIGYVGESYIDYGPYLMFLPILCLGWFWGRGYRWLAEQSHHRVLGVSTAAVFIMSGATQFEASNIKIVGGGLTDLIVLTLVLRIGGPSIWQFLRKSGMARESAISAVGKAQAIRTSSLEKK